MRIAILMAAAVLYAGPSSEHPYKHVPVLVRHPGLYYGEPLDPQMIRQRVVAARPSMQPEK